MKQIFLKVYPNGKTSTNATVLNFDHEHNTGEIVIDFSEVSYLDWTKQLDLVFADGTHTFVEGTGNTLTVPLLESYLKKGTMTVQPLAKRLVGETYEKIKWQMVALSVRDSLNVLEDDTSITPSIAEQWEIRIEAVEDAEVIRQENENIRISSETLRIENEIARNTFVNYSNSTQYQAGNKVAYQGSSYVAKSDTIGHLPTDTTYWLLIAQKGDNTTNLTNKNWVVIGDSMTEVNFRALKNYHKYIQDWVGCEVYNYGISGTGFWNRYDVANTITQTPDLITIFMGTNDWANIGSNNKPLGVFGDTEITTISGCINTMITSLITKYPTVPIGIFTPLPRATNWGSNAVANTQGYTLEELSNLIIKICNHYSIPVLDLYHLSNLRPWNATSNALHFSCEVSPTGDGLHPNHIGQLKISYIIFDFVLRIMGSRLPIDDISTVIIPTPNPGYYYSNQNVTLTTLDSATVHYTTDGSTPNQGSPVYSTPIPVTQDTIIKCIAVDENNNVTDVNTFVYIMYVVVDNFNRANNTTTPGIAITGETWEPVIVGGGAATWGINSNALYPVVGGDTVCVVNSGESDGVTIEGMFAVNSAGSSRLIWRYQDSTHFFAIQSSAGTISIYRRDGSWVAVGSVAGDIISGDTIKIKLVGDKHEIYKNSVLIHTLTDAKYQTAVKHGFGSGANPASRFDEFKMYKN